MSLFERSDSDSDDSVDRASKRRKLLSPTVTPSLAANTTTNTIGTPVCPYKRGRHFLKRCAEGNILPGPSPAPASNQLGTSSSSSSSSSPVQTAQDEEGARRLLDFRQHWDKTGQALLTSKNSYMVKNVMGVSGLHIIGDVFSDALHKEIYDAQPSVDVDEAPAVMNMEGGGESKGPTGLNTEMHDPSSPQCCHHIHRILNAVRDSGLVPAAIMPTSVNCLHYGPSTSFSPHWDSRSLHGECIIVCSLGQPCWLTMIHLPNAKTPLVPKSVYDSNAVDVSKEPPIPYYTHCFSEAIDTKDKNGKALHYPPRLRVKMLLPPNTIYVMSGPSRVDWMHGIESIPPGHAPLDGPFKGHGDLPRRALIYRSNKIYNEVYLSKEDEHLRNLLVAAAHDDTARRESLQGMLEQVSLRVEATFKLKASTRGENNVEIDLRNKKGKVVEDRRELYDKLVSKYSEKLNQMLAMPQRHGRYRDEDVHFRADWSEFETKNRLGGLNNTNPEDLSQEEKEKLFGLSRDMAAPSYGYERNETVGMAMYAHSTSSSASNGYHQMLPAAYAQHDSQDAMLQQALLQSASDCHAREGRGGGWGGGGEGEDDEEFETALALSREEAEGGTVARLARVPPTGQPLPCIDLTADSQANF